jgi:serine/threonine-protein kinase
MPPDEQGSDPSDASFTLLDAYLQDLHAGRQPDRAAFLVHHPELADALDCLEALEQLAPVGTAAPRATDSERTLAAESRSAGAATPTGDSQATAFGDFELLSEIGRGGMGVIWKARQKGLDRIVAIKMIQTSHLASALQVERFVVEAKAMARLHHPHIVRIHESGLLHGQHFFVMEYIAGPSLAEALRQGPFPAEKAAEVVYKVAQAVEHLHGQGIVHRDLKPSNILLDEAGQPYVTDFGLVKMLGPASRVTTTGAILGTPAYMAPEQASGRPDQVGPASDIYALGTILYELLTGRPPFQGETPLDTLVQVLEGEPTRPCGLDARIPARLEMICLKCLEKAPEERYPTAAALAADLQHYLDGEDIEARSAGPWASLRRWARRQPALASRLCALVIFAVVAHINYQLFHAVSLTFHLEVISFLALWVLASVIFQWGLKSERWSTTVPFAWVTVDAAILTAMLWLTESETGPLLIGFPFLVAASGLWFRVPVVWYSTAVLEAAYGVVVFSSYAQGAPYGQPHHHVIFVVALAVLGLVVAYQVQRIRALSRYYEHRPLP